MDRTIQWSERGFAASLTLNAVQNERHMTSTENDSEVRAFWDSVANDWDIQIGEHGDRNRELHSDPVLWRFVGEVKGLNVLDAGCGTGYLARKLHQKGANVTGIDISPNMIELAQKKNPGISFSTDSCSVLKNVASEFFDLVIANYVLMDAPDLDGTLLAFHRVLKRGGSAVLIFSHPCFPQGRGSVSDDGKTISYSWPFSYFDQCKCVDPPWKHFKSEFIWFHRPLSDYWKAFRTAGFAVADLEEPRISEDKHHLVQSESQLRNSKLRPYSIAFRLVKDQSIAQPIAAANDALRSP